MPDTPVPQAGPFPPRHFPECPGRLVAPFFLSTAYYLRPLCVLRYNGTSSSFPSLSLPLGVR